MQENGSDKPATEYHNRVIDGVRSSWNVERLTELASDIEPTAVPLEDIFEFDEVYWFDDEFRPTCRAVLDHAERILAADTSKPIILSPDGRVVDGMHRVAKALREGRSSIAARRLPEYPSPDSVKDVSG